MNTDQKNQIIIDYLIHSNNLDNKEQYDPAIGEALHWILEHVPLDVFNLAAIGSGDEETHEMQKEARAVLFDFLDKAIEKKDPSQPAVFHQNSANGIKAQTFDSSNIYTERVNIYHAVSTLGVQEKYVRGILTRQHWLTDLDLQRAIKQFGLDKQVKVIPFSESSLRSTLDLAVNDHKDATQPYIIPLILNRGSHGLNQGSHWVAASVEVDPVSHTITYSVNDSLALSGSQKREYEKIIKAAIASKDDDYHNPFPASENWTVSDKSTITGDKSQTDGYSCGYRALYHIVNYLDARGQIENLNTQAARFKNTNADKSQDLVDVFYRLQLLDLSIPTALYEGLNEQGKSAFAGTFVPNSNVTKVNPDAINQFLTEGKYPEPKKETEAHGKVTETIDKYSPLEKTMRFPEGAKDATVTAVEYEDFFARLNSIPGIGQHKLDRLTLPYVNEQALNGLNAYHALNPNHATKEIVFKLALDKTDNVDSFIENLKFSLSTLSNAGLESLVLEDKDKALSKEAIQEIKAFVIQSGFACQLTLPETYQQSDLQKEIDQVVEGNIQEKNRLGLGVKPEETVGKVEKKVEQRKKIDFTEAVQTDVELQQFVEAEIEFQIELAPAIDMTEYPVNQVLRLQDLSNAVSDNNFSEFSGVQAVLTKTRLIENWHQLFGNSVTGVPVIGKGDTWNVGGQKVEKGKFISGVTDSALAHLLKDNRMPEGGLDFNHLPAGFFLIKDPDAKNRDGQVLHYAENYPQSTNVAPYIEDKSMSAPVSMSMTETILSNVDKQSPLVTVWKGLNQSNKYHRIAHQNFRNLLPDLAGLNKEDVGRLVELFGGTENFDAKSAKAFLEAQDQLQQLPNDPYDDDHIVSVKALDTLLGLDKVDDPEQARERRKALVQFAHQLQEAPINNHVLLTLLDSNKQIQSQLTEAVGKYNLTAKQLNALLRVHSSYGEDGVNKILTTWKAIDNLDHIDLSQIPSITHNVDAYESMLANDDLLKTCQSFNLLDHNRQQWFFQLYKNHVPKEDSDFLQLMAGFNAFSQDIVNNRKLDFYSLSDIDHPFSENVHMATAMGRMLTLLDNCEEKDRHAQWQAVAQLDLGPLGATPAIIQGYKKGRFWKPGIIIPEMRIQPPEFGLVVELDEISPKSNDDSAEQVQQRFFRYIANQEYRMPLPFYQRAVGQIEALGRLENGPVGRTELNTLYRLLAELTTGNNYKYFITGENRTEAEEKAKAQWNNIIKTLSAIDYKQAGFLTRKALDAGVDGNPNIFFRQLIISTLDDIKALPSVDVMDKLISIMTLPVRNLISGELGMLSAKGEVKKLERANDLLTSIVNAYGNLVFQGMQFYGDDKYQQMFTAPEQHQDTYGKDINLFLHHLLLCLKINKTARESDSSFDRFVIPLISTFAIDHNNLNSLNERYQKSDKPIKQMLILRMGEMLQDLTNNQGLDPQALTEFLDDLTKPDGILDQVEKSLIDESNEAGEKLNNISDYPEDEQNRLWKLSLLKQCREHDMVNKDSFEPNDLFLLGKDILIPYLQNQPKLKDKFPEGYFEKLTAKKQGENVKHYVDQHFKTTELKGAVESIRVRIADLSQEQQLSVMKKIVQALDRVESDAQKKEVLDNLAKPVLISAGQQKYEALLEAMATFGSQIFVYFIKQSEANGEAVTDLCEKATYFMSEAIPKLNQQFENLNMAEFAPLVVAAINAGHEKELTQPNIEVGKAHQQWRSLAEQLSNNKNNPEQLEQIIGDISSDMVDNIPSLKHLTEHLQSLKEPKEVTVVDTKRSKEEEIEEAEWNENHEAREFRDKEGRLSKSIKYEKRVETIQVPETGVLAGLKNLITWSQPKLVDQKVTKYYRIRTVYKHEQRYDSLDASIVGKVLDEVQQKVNQSIGYGYALQASLGIIDQLIKKYPSAKSQILPLARDYLNYQDTQKAEGASEAQIKYAYSNLSKFYEQLAAFDNQDMVIALCEYFSDKGHFKFTDLLTIFKGGKLTVNDKELDFAGYANNLSLEAKTALFTVVTALLNNGKSCGLEDISTLVNELQDPDYLRFITEVYSKAPYPELEKVNEWRQKEGDFVEMVGFYKEWSKEPVHRESIDKKGEDPVNGFNFEKAQKQVAEMKGSKPSDEELESIKTHVGNVRELNTDDIIKNIQRYRQNPKEVTSMQYHPAYLVALMAELLYRTKGLPQEGIGNNRKWGRSFEINTTQYLALYSLLKSEGRTVAGIGTGEGKSRIMMLAIACEWATGHTVDFVTADVSLATRDYLEYQSFFKAFGAETNLITSGTPIEQYEMNGINFSDASNLSLFRNKARSEGRGKEVIVEGRNQRCLLLDESDKTIYDSTNTRFNYSVEADESIKNVPWIYEAMVEFFQDPENEKLFHGGESDIELCNEKVRNFIKDRRPLKKDKDKVDQISKGQLEAWEFAAITALHLEYGKHYTLEANTQIITERGPDWVNQARLIESGSASKVAKFSFGVHQCLHARLNIERQRIKQKGVIEGNKLHKELNKKKYDGKRFPVDSETRIVYSSNADALIEDYDEIKGVSGTPADAIEAFEKANINYVDIPRHRGLLRIDRPYTLTKTQKDKFERIFSDAKVALSKDQPILLVCEDDRESKELYEFLDKKLSSDEKQQLHRISADTPIEAEHDHVENVAGQAGAITVTTAKLGRGTDIKLHDGAKNFGLHVIGTYLPGRRDYKQIVGRAGRFGAQGSSRIILSEEEMQARFKNFSTENFYYATESYLDHLQNKMAVEAQKERIIKHAVGSFRKDITEKFYQEFYKSLYDANQDTTTARNIWRKFFDASDKKWNETWPKISDALAKRDFDQVQSLLQKYNDDVQGYWEQCVDDIRLYYKDNDKVNLSKLGPDVGRIHFSNRAIELLNYDLNSNAVHRTPIADSYSEDYKGRAVIYKGFWSNLWHNVLPSIFSWNDTPYTKARKNGNMSWSQFLLGGRLGTPPEIEEQKFESAYKGKDEGAALEKRELPVEESKEKIFKVLHKTQASWKKASIATSKNKKEKSLATGVGVHRETAKDPESANAKKDQKSSEKATDEASESKMTP